MFILMNQSNSKEINVADYRRLTRALEERLRYTESFKGLNCFHYWALPYLPHGKFLVTRQEWEDAGFGTDQITVKVTDGLSTVTFDNLVVESIQYIQAPLDPAVTDLPDYKDYFIVSVTKLFPTTILNSTPATASHKQYIVGYESSGVTLLSDLFTVVSGSDPGVDISFDMIEEECSVTDIAACIANTCMMTAYVGKSSTTSDKPKITGNNSSSSILLDTQHQMAYSRMALNLNPGTLKIHIQRKDVKNIVFTIASATQTLTYSESVVRDAGASSFNFNYNYIYPFYQTQYVTFTDDTNNVNLINSIKANASKRLGREFKIVYLGCVNSELTNDCQKITYAIDNIGLTTTFETVPWNQGNPLGIPKPTICTERALQFTLKSNFLAGIAIATISDPLDATFTSFDTVVEDPLNIFSYMKTGGSGYAIFKCNGRVLAIQAPCKPADVPPTDPVGRCCVLVVKSGSGGPSTQTIIEYCTITTAAQCAALNNPGNRIESTYGGDGTTCPCPE